MNKKIFGKQPSGERISGKTISGKGVRGSHIFHSKPSYKPIPVLAAAAFFAAAPFPADPVPAAFFPAASFLTVPFPAAPIPAYAAGWMQDGGRTAYELEDGSRPKDTWMELEGSWHYFDDQGFCRTGWYVDGQGKRFWLDGDGVLTKMDTAQSRKTTADGFRRKAAGGLGGRTAAGRWLNGWSLTGNGIILMTRAMCSPAGLRRMGTVTGWICMEKCFGIRKW